MGVRLFDRSTQGVVPTQYGDLLVKRAVEAFDAPKQGLRSIEFASCPGAGDAWVGFGKLAWYGLMPTVIQQLAREHLKIIVHAAPVNPSGNTLQHLSDFRAIAAGKATTMGHIQRKHLTEARIAVAPPVSMNKFDAVIASQFDQLVSSAQQSRALAQLRDTLLPKLISGELRVPDVERIVGATV